MTEAVFLKGVSTDTPGSAGVSPVWYLNHEQMSSFEEAIAYGNFYELQQFFTWLERTCEGKSVQFSRAAMQQVCTLLLRQLAAGGCEQSDVFSACVQLLSDGLYRQRTERVLPQLSACSQSAALLLAGQDKKKPRERPLEDRIILYISRHYTEADLSLHAMSGALGMTGNHVSGCLKRATGLSFTDYLNYVRVERAKYLLESTVNRVGDISADCGFSSSRYFSAVFKNCTGMTPLQYREKARAGSA